MGYQIACIVWITGACVSFISHLLLRLFAYRAVKRYSACRDARINSIYSKCAQEFGLSVRPPLLFGTLKEPACVTALLRPAIILNKEIASRLSDNEIHIVLCHELTHIKRKHHLARSIYDVITILFWFNPIAWVAKYEFAYICETDCDKHTLKSRGIPTKEYTSALLRLLELSQARAAHPGRIGALGFLAARRRFADILRRPSRIRAVAVTVLVSLIVAVTIVFSVSTSRGMFYPFPAYTGENRELAE